jgi:hypothetical protein
LFDRNTCAPFELPHDISVTCGFGIFRVIYAPNSHYAEAIYPDEPETSGAVSYNL